MGRGPSSPRRLPKKLRCTVTVDARRDDMTLRRANCGADGAAKGRARLPTESRGATSHGAGRNEGTLRSPMRLPGPRRSRDSPSLWVAWGGAPASESVRGVSWHRAGRERSPGPRRSSRNIVQSSPSGPGTRAPAEKALTRTSGRAAAGLPRRTRRPGPRRSACRLRVSATGGEGKAAIREPARLSKDREAGRTFPGPWVPRRPDSPAPTAGLDWDEGYHSRRTSRGCAAPGSPPKWSHAPALRTMCPTVIAIGTAKRSIRGRRRHHRKERGARSFPGGPSPGTKYLKGRTR